LERTVTGHIDILQTWNKKIHILDYKPKAEKVEPVDQLLSYVKALSYRTGIPKTKFKAAWFNESVYRKLIWVGLVKVIDLSLGSEVCCYCWC